MSNTDPRTVVLASDGRLVTLGRYSEPTAEELANVRAALAAQGITAWLATMSGSPYARRKPTFAAQELLTGEGDFAAAVAAFHAANVR